MHIVNWFHANQCILNMDITNIVKFTINNGTSQSLSFEYASKLLTEVHKFKFLGLCVDYHFMFMGPCIFIYEDHISNQRDATFLCSFIDSNTLYMFWASLAHHQELRNCVCSLRTVP